MRKKLSDDQKRSYILGVKVNASVRNKLLDICDREGITISSLIYAMICEFIEEYYLVR